MAFGKDRTCAPPCSRRQALVLSVLIGILVLIYTISYNFNGSPMLRFVRNPCKHSTAVITRPTPKDNLVTPKPLTVSQDEMKLISLLSTFDARKPKAVIYLFLEGSDTSLLRLKLVLQSLDKYFNDEFHYPVAVLHQDFINDTAKEDLRNATNSSIFFVAVSFATSVSLSKPIPQWVCFKNHNSIFQRDKTRFFVKSVFQLPFMTHVEYTWRLGEYSILMDHIQYDVFKFMRANAYQYGYLKILNDPCICNLWETANKYKIDQFIQSDYFERWPVGDAYYNEFEISHTSVWSSTEYKEYMEHMDKTGGIYYHAWSEDALKSIGVSIFVPEAKIYQFTDLYKTHHALDAALLSHYAV